MRHAQSVLAFIARRLVPKLAYPVLAGPLRGKRFILGAAAGPAGGATILIGRSETEQTAEVARSLRAGDVFYDVGANVGYYSLLASALVGEVGRVIALEPVVRNVAYLQRHLEINRARNVTVLPFACSDEGGYGLLQAGDDVATGHLASPGEAARGATPVHLVTVDAVAALVGAMPTALKIDVEGAELKVLRGADGVLRQGRPRIFLSVHSDALRADCLALLRTYGYEAAPLGGTLSTSMEYVLTPAP